MSLPKGGGSNCTVTPGGEHGLQNEITHRILNIQLWPFHQA